MDEHGAIRRAGTGQAHPAVTRWADVVDPIVLHLSVVSIMEIEIGTLRLARRDGARATGGRLVWPETRSGSARSGGPRHGGTVDKGMPRA
jgi:hypothetical protein